MLGSTCYTRLSVAKLVTLCACSLIGNCLPCFLSSAYLPSSGSVRESKCKAGQTESRKVEVDDNKTRPLVTLLNEVRRKLALLDSEETKKMQGRHRVSFVLPD